MMCSVIFKVEVQISLPPKGGILKFSHGSHLPPRCKLCSPAHDPTRLAALSTNSLTRKLMRARCHGLSPELGWNQPRFPFSHRPDGEHTPH